MVFALLPFEKATSVMMSLWGVNEDNLAMIGCKRKSSSIFKNIIGDHTGTPNPIPQNYIITM